LVYRVLYREWRPQDFHRLVGQDHISQTLQNAVIKGRIAHAYLFAGPRGTGKTSTAKIMAKAVNCLSLEDGQPCNTCMNCESINNGRSLDVIEIDAASNRGIDEIRELRERVNFVPSQGKYKVYIIDEVHMLTTEAFNALLKTLEEPPAHVIFILATTEPQKIPATILSRCQRFDFRKISPREMEGRLREILEASGFTAEEGALALIIKKAEGGLRDAISILDQCMSFSSSNISLQTAHEVLGLVKSEALISLTDSFIEKDAATLLIQLNAMLKEGIEPAQIIRDLIEHLRNMILLLVCGSESSLVLVNNEEKEILLNQARQMGLSWLSGAVALLSKIDSESRWRQNMRIVVETTLLSLLFKEEREAEPVTVIKGGKKIAPEKTKTGIKPALPEAEKRSMKDTAQDNDRNNDKNNDSNNEQMKPHEVSSVPPGEIKEKWQQVMDTVKNRKKTMHAFLTECEPGDLKGGELALIFKSGYTFHKEKVEEPGNKKLLEEVLEQVFGFKLYPVCVMENESAACQEDPVQKALDLFGSGIVQFKE